MEKTHGYTMETVYEGLLETLSFSIECALKGDEKALKGLIESAFSRGVICQKYQKTN